MTRAEVTRIVRIVFLVWLVFLVVLGLTTIVTLLPLPDQKHGREEAQKQSLTTSATAGKPNPLSIQPIH